MFTCTCDLQIIDNLEHKHRRSLDKLALALEELFGTSKDISLAYSDKLFKIYASCSIVVSLAENFDSVQLQSQITHVIQPDAPAGSKQRNTTN